MYHVSRGNVINRNCMWPNRSKEDIDKALNKDNSKDKPNQLTMWVDGDKQMAFYKKLRINILKNWHKSKACKYWSK